MRGILSGSRGMSPVVLVILIAWALRPVIFLRGTRLAARSPPRTRGGATNSVRATAHPGQPGGTEVGGGEVPHSTPRGRLA